MPERGLIPLIGKKDRLVEVVGSSSSSSFLSFLLLFSFFVEAVEMWKKQWRGSKGFRIIGQVREVVR